MKIDQRHLKKNRRFTKKKQEIEIKISGEKCLKEAKKGEKGKIGEIRKIKDKIQVIRNLKILDLLKKREKDRTNHTEILKEIRNIDIKKEKVELKEEIIKEMTMVKKEPKLQTSIKSNKATDQGTKVKENKTNRWEKEKQVTLKKCQNNKENS